MEVTTLLEEGERSSLYREGSMLYRVYHDTGRRSDSFLVTVDERGKGRCSHNRLVEALERDCQRTYSGSEPKRRGPAPPRVKKALLSLFKGARTIDEVSLQCGVSKNTAWSYLCEAASIYPQSHQACSKVIHPSILEKMRWCSEEDMKGSLKEVMEKLDLSTDPEVRGEEDRYAQLRLARILYSR